MKQIIVFFLLTIPFLSFSQLGGNSVYEFVNTPYSARENALGGNSISLRDGDVSIALKNPSLLDTSCSYKFAGTWGGIHISETNIGLGSFGYAQTISPRITTMCGIQFINYGRFSGYDEDGNSTGNFFASDYQIILGGSYNFFRTFYAGLSIKPILSYLETYSSYGLLGDLGVSYVNPESQVNASFIVRNFGTQLTKYTNDEKEAVPYSIDCGITKKLKHAPFRFTVIYNDLQKFELTYTDILKKNTNLINQDVTVKDNIFTKIESNLMKHFQFSSEILLLKNIDLLVGYNYRKSSELSFGASKKAVGLSLGFNIHVSYFNLSYGWSKQYVAGGTNYFTFSTDLDKIYSKITKI